jgi:threonine/homoserine/homoserine lactone efflux protein
MPDSSSLAVFMAAAFVLLVTPGPAVLYIVARSIEQGRLAGIVSVFGIGAGALVHVAGAALGLSAILMSSALAFNVVKWLGAAYLIYLGIHKLFFEKTPSAEDEAPTFSQRKLGKVFRQGFVVNMLNPKTALFFFAFLPQFVDGANGSVTLQVLFLGTLFITMAIFSDSTYALLAGTAGNWLRRNVVFLKAQKYMAGMVYLLLGMTTALAGNRQ